MSWRHTHLKRVAAVMPSNVDKHSIEGEASVRLCNYVDVYKNERITPAIDFMLATAADAQVERFTLRSQDVIVTKDSEEPTDIGIPAYVPEDLPGVVCGYHLAVLRPEQKMLFGGYLHWALQSASTEAYFTTAASGISRYALGVNDLGMTPLQLPALGEQQRIANFLDDKTARIDALIAEKERLVERIHELRNSEFSQALVQGIRPNPELCPTGNPVIPELPQGWKLSRLKWVCSLLRDGTHTPPSRVDAGVPLLSVRNIKDSQFTFLPDDSLISEADYLELNRSFEVRRGDVLLAVVGATMGKVAEVEDMGRPFQIQRSLAVMRPKASEIAPALLAAAIRSEYFQRLLWQNTGFSAQPGTYLGALADFPVPVPPIEEQSEIMAHLALKSQGFDNLTRHCAEHIARLREYRSSLISAAVTGQIDVGAYEMTA